MAADRGFDDNGMGNQFVAGEAVFDSNGDKVGTVGGESMYGRYLVVQKGWLFPKDIYVPLSAVVRNDAEGVYLNLRKDDLSGPAYENLPADGATGVATMIDDTTSAAPDAGATATRARNVETDVLTGDVRVPVMEEELIAGKQRQETGRVRVHKDVIEEQQTIGLALTQEEVQVERVSVQGRYADVGPDAFVEKDIDIAVMGERLVASKSATVTEEVRLRKTTVTEQQQVTDTVRKERVVVEGADQVPDSAHGSEVGPYNRTSIT